MLRRVVQLQLLDAVVPVSYTHLDVYKRQELELTCEQLEVQPPAAEELLGLFKKYEFKRWTADAVSYTHLDVYKRQADSTASTLSGSARSSRQSC